MARALYHCECVEENDRGLSAVIAGMIGIAPKDELEAMLAAQLLASHHATMECYRRAAISGQTFEGRQEALNQANKLSRTHTTLLEALNRHRGKGQQKVTVEHVTVNAGGQAIVGTVAPIRGGGVASKNQDQPHAPRISNEPQSQVWSTNSEREAVPIPSDEERPMPDAWWQITGSTEGK